jgi:hypothetical protein
VDFLHHSSRPAVPKEDRAVFSVAFRRRPGGTALLIAGFGGRYSRKNAPDVILASLETGFS